MSENSPPEELEAPKKVALDRDDAAEFKLAPEQMEELLGQIQAGKTSGPLGRLAELSRGVRALIVGSFFALASVVLVVAFGMRGDLDETTWPLFGVFMALTALSAALLLRFALRGMEEPPLSTKERAVALGAILSPALLALLSGAAMSGTLGEDIVRYGTERCFAFAGGAGLMMAVGARIFQRDIGWGWRRMVLAAGAGASVALLALGFHCPDRDAPHLALGHVGGYVAVLAGMYLLASLLDRRREG